MIVNYLHLRLGTSTAVYMHTFTPLSKRADAIFSSFGGILDTSLFTVVSARLVFAASLGRMLTTDGTIIASL